MKTLIIKLLYIAFFMPCAWMAHQLITNEQGIISNEEMALPIFYVLGLCILGILATAFIENFTIENDHDFVA